MGEAVYDRFLREKVQDGGDHGFEPAFLPDFLFDFQRALVEWATRKGRAALFAQAGAGSAWSSSPPTTARQSRT
jgi:hypothetical protein